MNMKKYSVKDDIPAVVSEPIINFGFDTPTSISAAREGVTFRFLLDISNQMSLSLAELSEVLHVSLRTLQRYVPSKKLDTDASAKALQLAAIFKLGVAVFGSEKATTTWLNSPVAALGGLSPKTFFDTPFGFTLLEEELNRIQHGVFS